MYQFINRVAVKSVKFAGLGLVLDLHGDLGSCSDRERRHAGGVPEIDARLDDQCVNAPHRRRPHDHR